MLAIYAILWRDEYLNNELLTIMRSFTDQVSIAACGRVLIFRTTCFDVCLTLHHNLLACRPSAPS